MKAKKLWLVVLQGPFGNRLPFGFPTKKGQQEFIRKLKQHDSGVKYLFSLEKAAF